MRQVSDEKILDIAKAVCWKYRVNRCDKYRFTDSGILLFSRSILIGADDSKGHVGMMTARAYESGMSSGLRSAQDLCEAIESPATMRHGGELTCEEQAAFNAGVQSCCDAIANELTSRKK